MTARSEYFLKDALADFVYQTGLEIEAKSVSKEQFWEMCEKFPELRLERENNGTIKIMAPVSGFGGFRENELLYYLTHWAKTTKQGRVASPSSGFNLPDGTTKCPDAAWFSSEVLEMLSFEEKENGFPSIVPDFVAEIRSKTDRLKALQEKMTNSWIKNGVKLGWLIDPYDEKVFIYRANGSVEIAVGFDNKKLSGEDVLVGFQMNLEELKLEK